MLSALTSFLGSWTRERRRPPPLRRACAGDEQLLAELVQLLHECTRSDDEMDSGAQAVFSLLTQDDDSPSHALPDRQAVGSDTSIGRGE